MPPVDERQPQPSTSAQNDEDLADLMAGVDDDDDEWLDDLNIPVAPNQVVQSSSFNSSSLLDVSGGDFDKNAGGSWIFPVGFEKRDYQLNISRSCLFTNTLVCLPTGLGKTLIASVVIYNFFRWFPRSKIIFLAHSKPLVNQQIQACYDVVGIPPSETVELTGKFAPAKRRALWESKRVFFATPQVIQNDIRDEVCPINSIKLVVVDEAHKAKGNFAYCEVVKGINAVNQKFRVVALSATPGKGNDLGDLIENLLIAKLEVRTENSVDVKKYTFSKEIIVLNIPLGELQEIRDSYMSIVEPYLRKLYDHKVIDGFNPQKGWIILQQQNFTRDQKSHPHRSEITGLFSISTSLLYSLELLERHGVQSFLNSFVDESVVTKVKYFVGQDRGLKDFIQKLNEKYKEKSPLLLNVHPLPNGEVPSINGKDLLFGHPKFNILKLRLEEFFKNGGTKTIIFCEFRITALLVYTLLLTLRPVVLPKMLTGQGKSVSQKDQLAVMKDFRSNKANALVTTSVAEEGIDVGEVDLVICFDVNSKNLTKFVQRIGRTGRKRKGKVLLLATEGREEENIRNIIRSKNNLNKSIQSINKDIASKLYKNSPRLVPTNFMPKCVETRFNIPKLEEEDVKPNTKAAKAAARKIKKEAAAASTKSIAAHFKPKKKEAESVGLFDQDQLGPTQNISLVLNEQKKIAHINVKPFSFELSCEVLRNSFKKEMALIIHKVEGDMHLSEHLKVTSENDLMMLDNFIDMFNNNTSIYSDEIFDLDLNLESLLDASIKPELNPQITTKAIDQPLDSNERIQIKFESEKEEFEEVESRYGNQFSIPEPFNTPFKSSPFQPINNIFNSTMKTTPTKPISSSGIKRTLSGKRRIPLEQSPLIKAFERQKSMSTSTPVTSRVPSFHKQSFSHKDVASTSTATIKMKEKSVLQFFGITSIDDIFNGLEDDADSLVPSTNNSIANTLDNNDDFFLNSIKDEEEVESSLLHDEVFPPKQTKKEEKFEFNLDEIFGNSNELENNITNVSQNVSDDTEEYDVESSLAKVQVKTPTKAEKSPLKENILIVNSVVVVDSPSPKKATTPKARPNFAKLLNALKFSNFLTPSPSVQPHQSPNSSESSKLNVPSPLSVSPKPSVSKPISTTSAFNSTVYSMASPISSRVQKAPPKKRNFDRLNDSIDQTVEKTSFALPIRKKVSRKRKRNDFLETQAGVDGSDSSDEDDDESLDGFIADDTVDISHEEDDHVDMHANYLKSLRSPSARQNGNFKIPQLPQKPINMSMIFSQVPVEDDDWEMDSFVVADVDIDDPDESQFDELEIAERKLKEKRRRAKQQKNGVKRRKVVRMEESSDEDEELERVRKHLLSNPD